jgi:hypothetical protein
MKHPFRGVVGLILAFTACSEQSSPLAPDATESASLSQGGAPTDISSPPAIDPFVSAVCGFSVLMQQSGKEKVLELPGERTFIIGPGLTTTLTNANTGTLVTRSSTGVVRFSTLADGSFEIVLTGNNLVASDVVGDTFFESVSGRFTILFGPDGLLVHGLEGNGRRVDMCALLSA